MPRQVSVVEYSAVADIPNHYRAVGGLKVTDAALAPDDLLFIDGTVYSPGAALPPGIVTWGGVLKEARIDLPAGVQHVVLVVAAAPTGDPWYYWFDVATYTGLLAILF